MKLNCQRQNCCQGVLTIRLIINCVLSRNPTFYLACVAWPYRILRRGRAALALTPNPLKTGGNAGYVLSPNSTSPISRFRTNVLSKFIFIDTKSFMIFEFPAQFLQYRTEPLENGGALKPITICLTVCNGALNVKNAREQLHMWNTLRGTVVI